MKNFLLLISICVVLNANTAKAQVPTTPFSYRVIVTDHFAKTGELKAKSIKYLTGRISMTDKLLTVDMDKDTRQVYSIIKYDSVEPADDLQTTRTMYLLQPTKNGAKVIMGVLLISAKGKITDVVLKKTGATHVDYVLD